jgi:hypothetical protein
VTTSSIVTVSHTTFTREGGVPSDNVARIGDSGALSLGRLCALAGEDT